MRSSFITSQRQTRESDSHSIIRTFSDISICYSSHSHESLHPAPPIRVWFWFATIGPVPCTVDSHVWHRRDSKRPHGPWRVDTTLSHWTARVSALRCSAQSLRSNPFSTICIANSSRGVAASVGSTPAILCRVVFLCERERRLILNRFDQPFIRHDLLHEQLFDHAQCTFVFLFGFFSLTLPVQFVAVFT